MKHGLVFGFDGSGVAENENCSIIRSGAFVAKNCMRVLLTFGDEFPVDLGCNV